jgi:Na+/H+ antiporter NhaD/arsenite permease-like protein
MAIVHTRLKGELVPLDAQLTQDEEEEYTITAFQRDVVFILGVGGLCSVPVFHSLTGLPPFVGILSVFGLLWFITEIMYFRKDPQEESPMRVTRLLPKIDLATIFFFLGILMTVAVLAEVGVLADLGNWLQHTIGNSYLVTGIIGVVSSIVDNVPLVACAMKMYPICQTGADFCVDGQFWQLLSFCAGTGGSMLIIGSAAGVVVMGLEKISFGWYLKRITPIAFAGYLCGILSYWLLHSFL